MVQGCEHDLQQEQQHRDAAKDGLERLTHTLNAVKAGVLQLSDKLQPIPLVLLNSVKYVKHAPQHLPFRHLVNYVFLNSRFLRNLDFYVVS